MGSHLRTNNIIYVKAHSLIHLMIFTTSDIHWACTKHFTQWKSKKVYTSVELLWTCTLTVKRNNGDDDNGLVIMMTMIRVHPRRQRLLTTDFNVQWEILPPIAHLGYELREIKVLLLEGNNMHISWNTFLCLFNCGIFKQSRNICCLPLWWMVGFQFSHWRLLTLGVPWLSKPAGLGAYWRSCHGIQFGSFLSSLGFGTPSYKISTLPYFSQINNIEIYKSNSNVPQNKKNGHKKDLLQLLILQPHRKELLWNIWS